MALTLGVRVAFVFPAKHGKLFCVQKTTVTTRLSPGPNPAVPEAVADLEPPGAKLLMVTVGAVLSV